MSERSGYIQRIRFEDKIMEATAKCSEAFATGNIRYQINSVSNLHSLLYAIPDVKGLVELEDEIKKINGEVKKNYDDRMVIYNNRVEKAMCPDVIEKPKLKFEADHIDMKYREILKVYAKNDLTIKSKNITHM